MRTLNYRHAAAYMAAVLAMAAVTCATARAADDQTLLAEFYFEQDTDGDSVGDGWHAWRNLADDVVDEKPTYWLETGDKAEGNSAQACRAPKKKAGIMAHARAYAS